MSNMPVVTSTDLNAIVAVHCENVPLIGTDDSTSNLIVLSSGVTSYVGTCARTLDGIVDTANATRIASRANLLHRRTTRCSRELWLLIFAAVTTFANPLVAVPKAALLHFLGPSAFA